MSGVAPRLDAPCGSEFGVGLGDFAGQGGATDSIAGRFGEPEGASGPGVMA